MSESPAESLWPHTRTLLVLVIAGGALLRVWGLAFGLPHPFTRPDEEVIVDVALGALSDRNPHFFDWPTLFIYLTSIGYAVMFGIERAIGGTITNPAAAKSSFEPLLVLIPRALSVSAGVATIAALFGAARELFSRRVALIAAAFLAVAFLHVRDSHFGVTDVPATFLAVCAFWAGLRCATRGLTTGLVANAGALCGLSASTKYNTVLVLLPAVLAILSQTIWNPPRSIGLAVRHSLFCWFAPRWLSSSGRLTQCLITEIPGGGDWRPAPSGERARRDGAGMDVSRNIHTPLRLGNSVGRHRDRRRLLAHRAQPRAAVFVLAFPIPYYLVLGSGLTVFVRYMIPIVPFLCLTAAVAVERFADTIGRGFPAARARDVAAAALSRSSRCRRRSLP